MSEKRIKTEMEGESSTSGADDVNLADKQLQSSSKFTVSHLPEEVLDRIFSQLTGPRNFLSVSNATPQFRRILKPSIPVWSFAEVFTLIYPELDKDSILNCRLVCRQWNRVVDSFVQTHPISRCDEPYPYQPTKSTVAALPYAPPGLLPPRHSPQFLPTLRQKDFVEVSFGDALEITRFLENVIPSHFASKRSPILQKYVDLSTLQEMPGGPAPYWNEVRKLLSHFGHHLTRVNLEPRTLDITLTLICYQAARTSLSQMTNLSTLSIRGFDCYGHRQPHDTNAWQQTFSDLQNYIATSPLPQLPRLKAMETNIPSNPIANLVNEELFKRYSPQLSKVFMALSIWTPDKNETFNFESMVELQLDVDQCYSKLANFIESVHAPKLQKLQLSVYAKIKIFPVLESICRQFPFLEYLKLRFRRTPDIGYGVNPPTDVFFRNIKTLEVVDSSQIPYEVLVSHLTGLEFLLVTTDSERLAEQSSWANVKNIKRREFREQLYSGTVYQMDIWKTMGSLKELIFAKMGEEEYRHGGVEAEMMEKKRYTRKKYEDYKKASQE